MSKSKRPSEPEGPDRLAMPATEVQQQLEARITLGVGLRERLLVAPSADAYELLGALSKWSATTETALDNLFIGSKTSNRYHESGRRGSAVTYDSIEERLADAFERHQRRLDALESINDGLPYMRETTPYPQPTRPPPHSWADRPVTINVQSGNVNLGTVVGDVTSNVSGLTGRDAEIIKVLIARLAAAVVDADLDLEVKAEAVESVEVVSEALKAGAAHKPSAILRSAIRRIPLLLQTTDQALKVWTELQGLLGPHLPPGTI